MTTVPFRWDEFQANKVVVEFVCKEHISVFQTKYFPDGIPYRGGERKRSLFDGVYGDIDCWRFINGVWQSYGYRCTYDDSEYDDYLHMVYDPDLDDLSGCVEVGDLL